jgi:hypothetical protein
METISPYFNTQLDTTLHKQLVQEHGLEKAREIGSVIYAGNFRSQGWEVTGATGPYEFSYYILDGKLVHESDLHSGRDILEGVRKDIRYGLEYEQSYKFRQRLLTAEIGGVAAWISPKKTVEEGVDCYYEETQVNVAFKINEDEIKVRQFQSKDLNISQSALLLNMLASEDVLNSEPELEDLMLTVIEPEAVDDRSIQEAIERITGVKSELEDLSAQVRRSEDAGRKYQQAIEAGVTGKAREMLHANLLKNTIDYKTFQKIQSKRGNVVTSCGIVSFGSEKVPSWCAVGSSGEISCRFCQKNLTKFELNSHRCVC